MGGAKALDSRHQRREMESWIGVKIEGGGAERGLREIGGSTADTERERGERGEREQGKGQGESERETDYGITSG